MFNKSYFIVISVYNFYFITFHMNYLINWILVFKGHTERTWRATFNFWDSHSHGMRRTMHTMPNFAIKFSKATQRERGEPQNTGMKSTSQNKYEVSKDIKGIYFTHQILFLSPQVFEYSDIQYKIIIPRKCGIGLCCSKKVA